MLNRLRKHTPSPLQHLLRTEIAELSAACGELGAGIYAPVAFIPRIGTGTTAQFTTQAATFRQRQFNPERWRPRIEAGLATRQKQTRPECILDIGSGSGNTVVPLLQAFPRSRILACDISLQLLRMLKDYLDGEHPGHRVDFLCLDLNEQWFHDGIFDLAVGGAILHHLMDPPRMVRYALQAVKAEGAAIFYEPFEPGSVILANLYRQCLRLAEASERYALEPSLAAFFRNTLTEYGRQRCDPDKDRRSYEHVDDKWFFSRSYFEQIAAQSGARLTIRSINDPEAPFTQKFLRNVEIATKKKEDELPAWVVGLMREADASFSALAKQDIPLEACVVMEK